MPSFLALAAHSDFLESVFASSLSFFTFQVSHRASFFLVGVAKAKELVFTGRAIDGAEALSLGFPFFLSFLSFYSSFFQGLVNYNVPNEEQAEEGANTAAFEKCLEICRLIGENGPIGVRAAKRAINNGLQESSIANAMLREQEQYQVGRVFFVFV